MYVKRRAVTEDYKRVVQSVVCAEVPSFFVFCFFGSLCRKTRRRENKKKEDACGGRLLPSFSPGGILQDLDVHATWWQLHVPDYRPSDEAVAHACDVRVPFRVDDGYVCEFDVQVLVDAVQRARDGEVIFQLDDDVFSDQGFEVRVEEHCRIICEFSLS